MSYKCRDMLPEKKYLAIALLLLSGLATAKEIHFPPPPEQVCDQNNIVDKEKLAGYLLEKYPVSVLAVQSANVNTQASDFKQKLLAVLLTPNICKDKCAASDQQYLDKINGNMSQVLAGFQRPAFVPTAPVDPSVYFSEPTEKNPITCGVKDGKFIQPPGLPLETPRTYTSRWRVRGDPNQLYVDSSDEKAFDATTKATIGIGEDNVARSKTSKAQGYLGYSFVREGRGGNDLEVVPYLGVNRNVVTVAPGNAEKPSNNDTTDAGVLISKYIVSIYGGGSAWGHLFNVRPDFLWNFADGSRLATLNLEYLPVKTSFINDFIRIGSGGGGASFKPVLSIKNDYGHYTDRGNPTVAASNDNYDRAGPQLGVVIVSDTSDLPLDFTTTYTRLFVVSGETEIKYFKNSLSYNFDKYVSLSLSNSHGLREDTAKNENLSSLDLTGRF